MNRITLSASLIVMLGSTVGIATAQAQDIVLKSDIQGYAVDQRNVVVRSGTGLCWRSGSWTPAMAIAACDPDLVKKPAPPPAPVPAPVATPAPKPAPPPPAPAAAKPCDFNVSLTSDETFAFGKAMLSGPAKAKLDKDVVAKLGGCAQVRLIVVTGHTDRLGTAQSNQMLSEKRAQAVTEYLFTKGVAASLFDTMGAGKTTPAQGVPKCDDKLPRAKLVACLAPHRRVIIEVKGTAK